MDQTEAQAEQALQDMQAEPCKTSYGTFVRQALCDELDRLHRKTGNDPATWKLPIQCEIHWSTLLEGMAAIEFFHGAKPLLGRTGHPDYIRITSPGYQG